MSSITCILISLLYVFNGINSEGYYTISAPRTIRADSPYYVAVSVHDSPDPCSVKVGLHGARYRVSTTVDVEPYSTELVELQSPKFKDNYNLTIEGTDGIIFRHEMNLNFTVVPFVGLIQTDRAKYKPNDLVRYRVLVLDENTKPGYNPRNMEILIQDGKGNEIKLVKNVILTEGVYSGEVQLSSKPVLGVWKIFVDVDGHQLTKDFEVENYILPKFEVLVETAENAFFADQKVHATIRAKYTFGKPVKGEATILVYGAEPESHLITRKVVQLDGKSRIEFGIQNELRIAENDRFNYIFIDATVEEKITGLKQNGSAVVNIQKNKYLIKAVKMPNIYVPGLPFEVKAQITTLDGKPVLDVNNPVKAGIFINEDKKIRNTESYLDRKGIATFEFRLPARHDMAYAHVIVTYRDVEQNIGGPQLNEEDEANDLQIEILTDKLTIAGDVSVAITSNREINYFMYQVIGRGEILLSKIEQFPDTKRHIIEFPASLAMAPTARLYVSTIHDGELYFDEKTIDFGENLLNYIKIDAPRQAGPGDDVELTVTTNRDSYVGLLAVDQSSLILKSGNDLSTAGVFHELKKYEISIPFTNKTARVPGFDSGLVTFTNADHATEVIEFRRREENEGGAVAGQAQGSPFKTRTEFPETWIWESFYVERNEDQGIKFFDRRPGRVTIGKKVPDTITSWIITGFSVNYFTGLGLTTAPRKLEVFQPFFVSFDIPYSMKRGEILEIPIVVFNYLEQDIEAEVTLDNTNQEFEFIDIPALELKHTKRVFISSNTGQSDSFTIRPIKHGNIKIKITARTPIAGDAMERMLLVQLEGVTEYSNKATFIDLRGKTTHTENLKVEIPANAVPDSASIQVSAVGNIVGPLVENLGNLVRLPSGCGEQNMIGLVPNIFVIQYFANVDNLDNPSVAVAKSNIEIGYQRQLNYKHADGSFSAWGGTGRGSTWLTAYVVRSLRQAAPHVHIDEGLITAGLRFLSTNQESDGRLTESGPLYHTGDFTELGKPVALTAYILLAFIENKKQYPEYQNVINRALEYVSSNIGASTDVYSLAIAAYTLQLADHRSKTVALDTLKSRATNTAGNKYWQYSHRTVEVTSYAFLAMAAAGEADLLPIYKWLLSQRNSNGGFQNTQDTVVGIQALIKANEKLLVVDMALVFNFGGAQARMTLNNDNTDVLQSHEIPSTIRDLSATATGIGAALIQLSYKYNVKYDGLLPRFTIKSEISPETTADHLFLTVCTSFIQLDEDPSRTSNMAVMEVNLPSGFTIDSSKLSHMDITDSGKKIETKNGDTVVVIYFNSLGLTEVCPKIEAFKTHKVAEQKPAAIVVYDYYDDCKMNALATFKHERLADSTFDKVCAYIE